MKNYILILFLIFSSACSKSNSSVVENIKSDEKPSNNITNAKLENSNTNGEIKITTKDESKNLDCSDPKGYEIKEERAGNFHFINFIQNEKIVETIKTPTGSALNGFALNWAKKTKQGFEISIEYGSRFYYEKNFEFVCNDHQLYLTEIDIETFDKNNPEKSSKESKKVIKPKIPLSDFEIKDFITEFGE